MKRFALLFAFAMVPAVASAETFLKPVSQMQPWSSASGEVKTQLLMCAGIMPCPPKVTVGRTTITGPLVADLAAFEGQKVTVLGDKTTGGFLQATGFASGSSKSFITGTVVNTNVCGPNARCIPHWAVQMGNYTIDVDNPTLNKILPNLEGATVTLRGDTTPFTCPVGAMCVRRDSGTFAWENGTDIRVKGDYANNAHRINGENGVLTFPNGKTIAVEGNTIAGNGTVWITGKMGVDPISKQPVLKSTYIKQVEFQGGFANPLANGGTNVGRADGTTGAANPADTQNAGFNH